MYSNEYMNDAESISSVDQYIKRVNEILEKPENAGTKFFFRGQAADYWDIRPSIFRKDILSVEHELMTEPLRIIPREFRSLGDTFEIMEKYQHYGLSTRLLDLTSNPLVALYFACESCDKEEEYQMEGFETEKRYPNGIVYLKQVDSALKYDDWVVKAISYISRIDYNGEVTLRKLIDSLEIEGVISEEFKNEGQLEKIISILQDAYVVLPAINNERLSRQSGAFLLPAKFNIKSNGLDLNNAIIEKAECDLREEFDPFVFYVEHDNKEKIRKELDKYNVNESSLFPELEYQLKHIQMDCESNKKPVARFVKYAELIKTYEQESETSKEISDELIYDIVQRNVKDADEVDDIINIFESNKETDWYKKNSVLSKIKVLITKSLLSDGYDKNHAETIARSIINDINTEKRG